MLLDNSCFGHYDYNDQIWRLKMNKNVSIAEAKATLSECIRKVETGSSVLITRHGKPVAALVRASDFHRLERLRKAGPEGGLASLAGGWEGSDELARILNGSHRVGQRETPPLDQ
jgi:prevent-host-death family protein